MPLEWAERNQGLRACLSAALRLRAFTAPLRPPAPASAPDLGVTTRPDQRRCCFDRQGWLEVLGGLVFALIALLSSYGHIALPAGATLHSNGASGASLPPWRLWLQTFNWRRDPDIERQIEQIESETAQLKQENRRLAELESRLDALLHSADSCSPTPPAAGSY